VDRAIAELGLDRSSAYVVGDQRRDIELGWNIGARTVLVTSGPTSEEALASLRADGAPPDAVAGNLGEAVEWIFRNAGSLRRGAPLRDVTWAGRGLR
jgi:phosphoglycolate phosphatase-like HAD superfamily hydrolase